MEIKKATSDQLDDIVRIWKDFMDCHKALDPFFTRSAEGHENFRKYVASILSDENFLMLVVGKASKAVGYVLAQVGHYPPVFAKKKFCLITDLVVEDAYRGQGWGRQLVARVKEWAAARGLSRIELRVVPGNERACEFYRKAGFKIYLQDLFLEF